MSGQFPQALWKPTPKDLAADFNPVQLQAGSNQTNTIAALSFVLGQGVAGTNIQPIPADKMAIVTYLSFHAVAGGAQLVNTMEWRFTDPATGTRLVTIAERTGLAIAQADLDVPVGELIVNPQQGLMAIASFSAAGVANTIHVGIHGYLTPRGNWQFS